MPALLNNAGDAFLEDLKPRRAILAAFIWAALSRTQEEALSAFKDLLTPGIRKFVVKSGALVKSQHKAHRDLATNKHIVTIRPEDLHTAFAFVARWLAEQ